MNEIMTYQQIINDVRERMLRTTENFVYIGWQLKQLISTGMMQQEGYTSIEELGKAEFGLNKDDTYRFIKINTKYSVNGDSPELDVRFKGIGQSKLSEMLNLPEEDLELITPDTKREDIRELNRFNKQEPKECLEMSGGDLETIITEFFRPGEGRPAGERRQMLNEILKIANGQEDTILTPEETIQECINPNGNATFRTGKYFVFMYEAKDGMKYKVFGSNDNHKVSYLEFARMTHLIFTIANPMKEGMDAWESFYGPEPVETKLVEEEKTEKQEERRRPEVEAKKPSVQKKEPEQKVETELEQTRLNKESDTVNKCMEEGEREKSYPQEKEGNSKKAPAQLEEEVLKQPSNEKESEEAENLSVKELAENENECLYGLRKEAEEYMEKIRDAMMENQYFLAKTETKHLLETLGEIIGIIDSKPMPGQIEMTKITRNPEE